MPRSKLHFDTVDIATLVGGNSFNFVVQPMVGGQKRDDGRRDQEDQGGSPPHEHHGEALGRAWGKAFQRDNTTRFFNKKRNKLVSDIVQNEGLFFSCDGLFQIYCSYDRNIRMVNI